MSLEIDIRDQNVAHGLALTADRARQDFDAVIWFADIFGYRWSYIAGRRLYEINQGDNPCGDLEKIPIGHGRGLVVADWGRITISQRAAFVEWLEQRMNHPATIPDR